MEYIEKAKYELIMALKNSENSEIVDVLRQYYQDMVNIVTSNKDNLCKNNIKYILTFNTGSIEGTDERESYVFTNEEKMTDFYKKFKHYGKYVTVLEIHDINPENTFRPNIEKHIDTLLNKNL